MAFPKKYNCSGHINVWTFLLNQHLELILVDIINFLNPLTK